MPVALALLLFLAPQAEPVDPRRGDEAIRRGVDDLRTARTPGVGFAGLNDSHELVLLTFVHAGVPETDRRFRELFQKMMEEPPANTYKVVLQAMILEAQRKDGLWSSGVTRCHPTWDTCFAILFLQKATRALVASEDGRARRRGKEK